MISEVGNLAGRTVTKIQVPLFWMDLHSYACFVGFGVSFVVYAGLMTIGSKAKA